MHHFSPFLFFTSFPSLDSILIYLNCHDSKSRHRDQSFQLSHSKAKGFLPHTGTREGSNTESVTKTGNVTHSSPPYTYEVKLHKSDATVPSSSSSKAQSEPQSTPDLLTGHFSDLGARSDKVGRKARQVLRVRRRLGCSVSDSLCLVLSL